MGYCGSKEDSVHIFNEIKLKDLLVDFMKNISVPSFSCSFKAYWLLF